MEAAGEVMKLLRRHAVMHIVALSPPLFIMTTRIASVYLGWIVPWYVHIVMSIVVMRLFALHFASAKPLNRIIYSTSPPLRAAVHISAPDTPAATAVDKSELETTTSEHVDVRLLLSEPSARDKSELETTTSEHVADLELLSDHSARESPEPPGVVAARSRKAIAAAKAEAIAVAEMRAAVEASLGAANAVALSDVTARRFLRARKLHVTRSAKMYGEYFAWRRRERIDDILSEAPLAPAHEEALAACFNPRMLSVLDSNSRPVLFLSIGAIDMAHLQRCGVKMGVCVRRYVRELERLQAAVEAAPSPERGQLALIDIAGCTPRKFLTNLRLLVEVARVGNLYYPELMGCLCVVRGPPAAAWSVRTIKRVLDAETGAKIELHSPAETPAALERHLGENWRQLTPELAG